MTTSTSAMPDAPDQDADDRASEVAAVRAELRTLGADLKAWRYLKGENEKRKRAEIHEQIRQAEKRGLRMRMTVKEIHTALGISRQALDNIRKNNSTGRRHHENPGATLDARLRGRLQELGVEWNDTRGTGMFEFREAIWDDALEAVEDALDAGLTRQETADVMGISYGQLDRILRG